MFFVQNKSTDRRTHLFFRLLSNSLNGIEERKLVDRGHLRTLCCCLTVFHKGQAQMVAPFISTDVIRLCRLLGLDAAAGAAAGAGSCSSLLSLLLTVLVIVELN